MLGWAAIGKRLCETVPCLRHELVPGKRLLRHTAQHTAGRPVMTMTGLPLQVHTARGLMSDQTKEVFGTKGVSGPGPSACLSECVYTHVLAMRQPCGNYCEQVSDEPAQGFTKQASIFRLC
jgi:hypothetical protein